jgi:squalene-hopene/tetraprenyl-beta-curcumene cyclase
MKPREHTAGQDAAPIARAMERASAWLSDRQHDDGFWWEDLRADASLEADYVYLQLWLHPPSGESWIRETPAQVVRAVASLRARQLPGGGFALYPGGPAEVSLSTKAYFAMKLGGMDVNEEEMVRLRERILSLGGLQAVNTYTRLNLSFLGLFPREHVPEIPPEIVLVERLIQGISAWSRTILVPLSIVQSLSHGRPLPRGFTLEELHAPGMPFDLPAPRGAWGRCFQLLDRAAKLWAGTGAGRLRSKAIRRCREWMRERTRNADGLGAIYPAMLYSIMAMECLGEKEGNPERREAERHFFNLLTDDGEEFFFQPCFSPVWDTATAAFALGEAGLAHKARLDRAADWMLSKESKRKGDWAAARPEAAVSGWYFQFANEPFPDLDDTGMVLLALLHARSGQEGAHRAAVERAIAWVKAMQSQDGGWAAFDADAKAQAFTHLPFADHNAILDPSCADITGRLLEALVRQGVGIEDQCVRRGVDYLIASQEADGSWYGRWGVNYIYGTYLALRGLQAAGESDREVHVLRAAEWLRAVQNADGGWGESCESYDRRTFVSMASTPSQTAWAVLGLIAAGDLRSGSAGRGIDYLIQTQNEDGTWEETAATGTGFPGVFYLTYSMYRNVYPLMAMAAYKKAQETGG